MVIKYIITNANNVMNLTRSLLAWEKEKYKMHGKIRTHHGSASWLSGSFSFDCEGNAGLEDRFEPISVPPSQAK
jgi:hypothetical protein